MEARQAEVLRETLDRLRDALAELRASRRRLVLAADADRRAIERELHVGVQQRLVSLAVNLQLADPLIEADPEAAKALLEGMASDVQQALDETARLAQRIYPPLLRARGLAAELRAVASSVGISASVEVDADLSCAPEQVWTIRQCWLEALEHGGTEVRPVVTVSASGGALAFDVVADFAGSDTELLRLRDRTEALGGQLTIQPEPGCGTRMSGWLPLAR